MAIVPWLLLIHQMPPRPVGLRLRVWRRLQRVGAVAIKNSVWALPVSEQSQEDFEWIRREIEKGGGDATIVKAELVEGLSDNAVKQLFHAARDAEYSEIVAEARALRRRGTDEAFASAGVTRLRNRFEEVRARDHLGAPGSAAAAR